ncbi:glycosyl hydrolase [Flammeovirga sp. SubArs3]|uniref:glycosyl hydrolase n=1 Tax=Flammeovirga sp. SubArs3 TaxID=2995316 RepID=UPI00248B841E|nr:glycosyl hydrolase [Flammeovirga sp. SubArs3]
MRKGILFLICFFSLQWTIGQTRNSCLSGLAKFAPVDGKRLLIMGQDLGAVGGLDQYTDGYVDHFSQMPAGITTYTSLPSLGGLYSVVNYGAGDVSGEVYLDDATFDSTALVIGLYLVDQEKRIVDGDLDDKIRTMANWIKNTNRPVFLRIGYEFDGEHNHYSVTYFKNMWRRIVDIFDEESVANCDFVWQSDGVHSTSTMQRYYPGSEYVDWFAFSYFQKNAGNDLIRLAKTYEKPVMIAEATPRGYDLKTVNGDQLWNSWFQPLIQLMDDNPIIKGLAYINTDWDSQQMWKGEGWGDTRIEVNEALTQHWENELQKENWVYGNSELFETIGYPFADISSDCFPPKDIVNATDDTPYQWGYVCNNEPNNLKVNLKDFSKVKRINLLDATTGKVMKELFHPEQNVLNIIASKGVYILSVEDFNGQINRIKVLVCN